MYSPTPDEPEQLGRPVADTEYSWCRAVEGGTGVTAIAVLLTRPVSVPRLLSSLLRLQIANPILRCNLTATSASSTSSDAREPFLSIVFASPVSILRFINAADVRRSLPPLAEGVSTFHAVLEHEMNQNPWSKSEKSVPVFFTTVYDLPEPAGNSVLALRFHAAVCDKTSAVAVLRELLGLLSQPPVWVSGSVGVVNRELKLMPGIEDLIPVANRCRAYEPPFIYANRSYSLNVLRTSTLLFLEPTSKPRRSEMVRMVMTMEETKKLLTACKERSIKLFGAILAAALIAARSLKSIENGLDECYNVLILIDCRRYLDPVLDDHTVGSYHSGIINTHFVHGKEELWSLAKTCHESYSKAMANKTHLMRIRNLNFLMCHGITSPHHTASSSQRTAFISVFEEPVVYQTSEVPSQLGVEDYAGVASVHGAGPSIAVFDSIQDRQLDCTFVYPSPVHSREQVQQLVEHMKRMLVEGRNENESESGSGSG